MLELYTKLKTRVLEGMVFHDEMSRYYAFLGLKGYAKCHEYHYAEETIRYRKLSSFFFRHYNRLIPSGEMDRPDVIPKAWYSVDQMKVDKGTKQSGIMKGYEKWIEWESSTKKYLSDLREDADQQTRNLINGYLDEICDEIAEAREHYMMLETIGYDLLTICSEQERLAEKYEKKIRKLL